MIYIYHCKTWVDLKYTQNVLTASVVSGGLNFSALLFQWASTYCFRMTEASWKWFMFKEDINFFTLCYYVTLNKQKTILQSDLIFM